MTTRDSALITLCFGSLLADEGIKSVTAFCPTSNCAKHKVRVTRSRKHGEDYSVAIGAPNFAERRFLKACRKAKTNPKKTWISEKFK